LVVRPTVPNTTKNKDIGSSSHSRCISQKPGPPSGTKKRRYRYTDLHYPGIELF
jgi:hypothetical protein